MNLSEKRLLTYREAAEYLSLSVTTFRRCVAPLLTRISPGDTKRVAWDREELDRYVNRITGKANHFDKNVNPLDELLNNG